MANDVEKKTVARLPRAKRVAFEPARFLATVGVGRQVILHPVLQKRYVELDEPALHDQRTDLERLQEAVDDLELRAEAGVLRRLPPVLRQSDFRVTAVVVLRQGASATEAEIVATARDRLAGFKTPKQVHFIDELPKNVSGKILKRELRDRFS